MRECARGMRVEARAKKFFSVDSTMVPPKLRSAGATRRAKNKVERKPSASRRGRAPAPLPAPPAAAAAPLDIGRERAAATALTPADAAFMCDLRVHTDALLSSNEVLPRTQNVVAKVVFDDTLNLHHIAANSFDVELQPSNFAAAIMRQKGERAGKGDNATSLLFGKGTLICVGTSSAEIARLASQRTRLELRKLGYSARFSVFKIVNRVMNDDMRHGIDISRFFVDHASFADYDPDVFPGCTYDMSDLGVVALIFDTGKVIVMGFKNVETGYAAVRRLRALLGRYRATAAQTPSAERYAQRIADKERVVGARADAARRAAFLQEMHDKFGIEFEEAGADGAITLVEDAGASIDEQIARAFGNAAKRQRVATTTAPAPAPALVYAHARAR
jgi:transcription initiation factor TFIID TATA-box-binding protein